jgi:hypothetical protein
MRRSKYNATKTVVDGITFASKAEAKRYAELKLLERSKEIENLECQPRFALTVLCGDVIGEYVADYRYWRGHSIVVEDVKGFKTPLYRWKKKHVEAQYGIKIVEIK